MFRRSALKAVSESVPSFQRRALSSVKPIPSSSSSGSQTSRNGFAIAAVAGTALLASAWPERRPIYNDTTTTTATIPVKRLPWHERSKANKGGVIVIQRADIEEAEEEEEEEEAAAEEETVPVVIVEDEAEAADADQGAAFDPATGEINWDCPCLGGMAHGPCGEHFKDAFSCFVRSEQEPKGIECVDKFKAMQDCFRAHPEVYKEELEMDEQVSKRRYAFANSSKLKK